MTKRILYFKPFSFSGWPYPRTVRQISRTENDRLWSWLYSGLFTLLCFEIMISCVLKRLKPVFTAVSARHRSHLRPRWSAMFPKVRKLREMSRDEYKLAWSLFYLIEIKKIHILLWLITVFWCFIHFGCRAWRCLQNTGEIKYTFCSFALPYWSYLFRACKILAKVDIYYVVISKFSIVVIAIETVYLIYTNERAGNRMHCLDDSWLFWGL